MQVSLFSKYTHNQDQNNSSIFSNTKIIHNDWSGKIKITPKTDFGVIYKCISTGLAKVFFQLRSLKSALV